MINLCSKNIGRASIAFLHGNPQVGAVFLLHILIENKQFFTMKSEMNFVQELWIF